MGPAARILAETHGVDLARVTGTGPRGNVTKEDVQAVVDQGGGKGPAPAAKPAAGAPSAPQRAPGEREERVKMSRLRARIAERLVEVQHTAAILTTFNEVDMGEVMAVRGRYKEAFREKYGMPIGFMSFFTKACIEALKAFPAVNAELDGDEVVYKHYYDIGVAVGTERGLVVPVVRDADRRSFIEVELEIARLAGLARDNKLTMGDLTGGTFTISNGGIYGSMLSTPIINPPQVAILGMHNIVKRAVVVGDEIKVRPMMYLALSYDHRIIDGREAVQFLLRVKECIEDPARILLEI
ncbi:MAG: 2-oxoglutarate dehydrogenase complex dihydrolipoyllysine-residue succinyltransferase [SAR324 cluster bacterium]|nr:2-oxoglutarate dehydrogenase complex dihydrolipoyllysine-residue succinyltransferase [SAR324 cluster bacterium]